MDRIKVNGLLHNLYNKMNNVEKEKFKEDIILLSKELLTKNK